MHKDIEIQIHDALSLDFVYIKDGSFMMGDANNGYDDERPVHQVRVEGFYMCRYQITQEVWEEVMKENPSRFKGNRRPIENISWDDVQDFLKKLNQKLGKNFRLPSESEWEYAARGGQYSQGYVYVGSDKLSQVGWYNKNSNGETKEVEQLLANELGLYDMSGNVREWCADDWHENYEGAPKDGRAWVDQPRGSGRVLRGGSYFDDPFYCRPAFRIRTFPELRNDGIGFRLVLSLQSVK